jgi:hypothetical protein
MKGGFEIMAFFLVEPLRGGKDPSAGGSAQHMLAVWVKRHQTHVTDDTVSRTCQHDGHNPQIRLGQREVVGCAGAEGGSVVQKAILIGQAKSGRGGHTSAPRPWGFVPNAHRISTRCDKVAANKRHSNPKIFP